MKAIGRWTVQIVKRSNTADGFEVLPRRWVVERNLADFGGVQLVDHSEHTIRDIYPVLAREIGLGAIDDRILCHGAPGGTMRRQQV